MKAKVKWVEDDLFLGTSESGHQILLETKNSKTAPCPLETILIALGSCSSVDVLSILKKSKQQVSDCTVEVSGTSKDALPKVFSKIHLHFIITGTNIKRQYAERAVTFSTTKYCSVALMLNGKVEISADFLIINE